MDSEGLPFVIGRAAQDILEKISSFPNLRRIVAAVLEVWPEHYLYCATRFRDDDTEFLDSVEKFSTLALKHIGTDLRKYATDYQWMCEEFLREEIYFRRFGDYRLKKFEEVSEKVYSRPEYMSRYVRGILISQLLWDPHARAFDLFITEFLPSLPVNASYLEVGPGHGFFLYFAAQASNIGRLEGWDVSQSSIRETRSALETLGVERDVLLVQQDVLQAPTRRAAFDAAVISEVLEHLERPDLALRSLHEALRPSGRVFINAPINSPAPDHIYLWRSTEEFTGFVEEQGFHIDQAHFLPLTGTTLERARRKGLSVSCVIIASKA